jgi:hypothetical protein
VLQVAGADDQWKNIVEWWLALLIGLYYLSSYGDWKDFHLLDT